MPEDTNESTDFLIQLDQHTLKVAVGLDFIADELRERAVVHDASKYVEPERSVFESVIPRVKTLPYPSPEYDACLKELAPALKHHYAANRHHPEHFDDGISGMTLVDLTEMFVDWKAASEQTPGGCIFKSIEHNRKRFNIDSQLAQILINTARAYPNLFSSIAAADVGPKE